MFTTRPELTGTFGMVASTHWLASACGMAVLERGGNAVDAAVTAGFVLQIVEPHLNGPGGDVPSWSPAGKARSRSTAARVRARPRRDRALPRPGARPGARDRPAGGRRTGRVRGLDAAVGERGTWRLRDVLEPAIGYAEDGHPLLPGAAATIRIVEQLFRDDWPTSAATTSPPAAPRRKGPVPQPGAGVDVPADHRRGRSRLDRTRRTDRRRPGRLCTAGSWPRRWRSSPRPRRRRTARGAATADC